MKIVIVISHLSIYGGGGKFIMDYTNQLSERGHDISVIAVNIDKSNYRFAERVNLIELGGPVPKNPLYWLEFNRIQKKYLRVLNKMESDLIVNLHFPTNYFLSRLKKTNKINYVHYCLEPYRLFHDKLFYSRAPILLKIISLILRIFFKKYDIIGMRSATEIIYISKFTGKRIKEWYGRNGILHYIGINKEIEEHKNFDLREKLELKAEVPIIFTLGLSTHLKGAKELIYIFEKVIRIIPEAILLIGGRPSKSNIKIITKSMKKLKIPKQNVIFYGFVEEYLINNFYKQSTLTFYTAIEESYGLIPLESMLNGTPVIAFEGGPSETILDGETGYIIKTNDLDSFAQKAITLIKNKELSKEFSLRGKEHVINNFSMENSISSLEEIFQKIINKEIVNL
ncbi:MAG: glycosyltransferase family 4 protein [Candidatus Odinarchaeota archaeon]